MSLETRERLLLLLAHFLYTIVKIKVIFHLPHPNHFVVSIHGPRKRIPGFFSVQDVLEMFDWRTETMCPSPCASEDSAVTISQFHCHSFSAALDFEVLWPSVQFRFFGASLEDLFVAHVLCRRLCVTPFGRLPSHL
jgi:hypothetical protein